MDRKKPSELSMAVGPEELQRFCDQWCEDGMRTGPTPD
jgi:hypothetical protein